MAPASLETRVAEGAEELVEEELGLAFFVALQGTGVGGEVREGGFDGIRGERQAARIVQAG